MGECVVMYTPSADCGHALYSWELLNALAGHPRAACCRFELVTSRNLEPRFRSDRYRIHAMLPPLRDRRTFRTRLAWAVNRLNHYARREQAFVDWLRGRPAVTTVHFQEGPPWHAAKVFRQVKRLG